MEDFKSFLIYLVTLVSLIGASFLYANQAEPLEITPLPVTTTPVERISRATTPYPAVENGKCADTAQGLIFAYVPDPSSPTPSKNDRLFIYGTIYASDGVTPLPDALVEVRPTGPLNERERYAPSSQIRTGPNGHYSLITTKPRPHIMLTVHYAVHYQDQSIAQNTCLLSMRLNVVSIPLSKSPFLKNTQPSSPPLTNLWMEGITEAGPVFHGPVDIVPPVPRPGGSLPASQGELDGTRQADNPGQDPYRNNQ